MTYSTSTGAPSQQAMPEVSTAFVNDNGIITEPWHRLLIGLWQKWGGGLSSAVSTAYLAITANGGLNILASRDNSFIGKLAVQPTKGQPETVVAIVGSPFEYTVPQLGTLLVESGLVEVSRSGTFYTAGLAGGCFTLDPLDVVRITWYSAAPKAVFFPLL